MTQNRLTGKDLEYYREYIKRTTNQLRDNSDAWNAPTTRLNGHSLKRKRARKRQRCECCKVYITDEDYQALDKLGKQIADLTKYGYKNPKLSFIERVCYHCFVKSEEFLNLEYVLDQFRDNPTKRQEKRYGTTLESIRAQINRDPDLQRQLRIALAKS